MSRMTLDTHLAETRAKYPDIPTSLPSLILHLASASRTLARQVARAALAGRLGYAGDKNVTGDVQKKLDVVGNETMIEVLKASGLIARLVSEEVSDPLRLSEDRHAPFVVCMDPIDGSSNTDINGVVGTIFGVFLNEGGEEEPALLRKGTEQIASGYVMYSTSTMLVYTCGHGVHGFTLDSEEGNFILTHPDIRCPARGKYYCANLGNISQWTPNLQRYVEHVQAPGPSGKPQYSLRYTGALVADLHRSLLDGGIYFYPADTKNKNGKLRLLYECAPLALLAEQAGGRASTGDQRILDIVPTAIHQRVPLAIGCAEDVAVYERYVRDGRT
ncbi:MAG: class 1 fructose-bisphosphatase [Nitrospirae bacterium]|nr:class 1 fructose-bisphosphatase [Nitrospirota bacterium]